MSVLLRTHATAAWFALMAATGLSWWLGAGHGGNGGETATAAVIAIAFVKTRVVGQYFMELRDAPLPLRLIFDGWALVVGGALIGIYLLA